MNGQKEDFRLRIFLTLAEELSFTRTAALLGISQPAVSSSVAELEKLYSLHLVERTSGGSRLTPEGEVFKDYAARVLSAYADLEKYTSEATAEKISGQTYTPADGRRLAAETVRALIPALRKMDRGFASELEYELNQIQDK